MKKIIFLLSLLSAFIFITSCKCYKSCCSSSGDGAKKINGTWELTFITGPRIAFDGLYPDKKPQLTFNLPDSTVTGNTGCNNLNTTASVKGNTISFGPAATTRMFCEGAGESTFLKMLQETDKFSNPDDNTLELSGKDVVLMRFTKK